ncbi:double-CXXCG motif protein [Pyxidicoccus trucidator]|uniref:SitI6 family double-CXXCG motif immunity protein n=1 Tax=Pyxidicoccus trucidator TaxID=2709662 RepID=UPI0013DC1AA3|nr:double-CXXCG motif protein [Pyxidicoccus trucidator]
MRFYAIEADTAPPYSGDINGKYKWGLPGVELCPTCRTGGGIGALNHPCADLTSLPAAELKKLSDPWPVPREELSRLTELVRAFVPPGARLEAGAHLGPLTGKGSGHFGPLFVFYSSALLIRSEARVQLQDAGLRGLERACPTLVRFRGKSPPELLDVQLEFQGLPHSDCVSPKSKPPCPTCGYADIRYLSPLVLDAASLPADLDVFRLREEFSIIVSERFKETVTRLELGGVKFREVEAR